MVIDMEETGFGVKYENNLTTYFPPHWHKAIEMLLFVKGTVICNFENAKRQFKKGDMYIINSHEVHETKCTHNAVYLVVHIDPNMMCRYVPAFDQRRFHLAFDPEDQEKAMAYEQLRAHMQEILRLSAKETDLTTKLERNARLFAVAAILVKHFSQPLAVEETKLQRSDMTRLEPLLEYIQLHHGEELPLDEAVEFMGLNKEYFCRLFKKHFNSNFSDFLNGYRIDRAKQILRDTSMSVADVAAATGFNSFSYFCKLFKAATGMSPTDYRRGA